MTINMAWLVLASALICLQAPTTPTFRGGTDLVQVNVAVFDGSRVVTNLDLKDFEVRDNGKIQTLKSVEFNPLPIDLRLVFDISGSISEEELARYLRTMRKVTEVLKPDDRCEIITFNTRVADAASRQHPPIAIKIQRGGADATAFFDAVSLALVTVPTSDRRQITIVLSDAADNASFFDEATMKEMAQLTDAVVYTILPGDPLAGRAVSEARLNALALITGGNLVKTHESAVGTEVIKAIDEFRQSYVVYYEASGLKTGEWRKLDVRVRGGYKVRAKSGYFAD
jgi:VWFA-related protein